MNLFSWASKKPQSPSGSTPTSQSSTLGAINKIRGTIDTLDKRQSNLEIRIAEMRMQAKKYANSDRNKAMTYLKRKKLLDNQLQQLGGMRMSLEQQIMSLESATTNLDVFNGMRTGASAMKAMNDRMDIDKVEDLTEDIQEQMDIGKEISEAISTPVNQDLFDDDELLNELAGIEEEQGLGSSQELAAKGRSALRDATVSSPVKKTASPYEFPEAPTGTPSDLSQMLPEAPTGAVQAPNAVELAELAALEAEFMT